MAGRVTRARSASSEATAKAAAPQVLVVENLDLQRHGVGLAADLAGDHRDRAELAHGAGVAEEHAVEQRPLHVGQRDAEEGLPAARAERQRRLLVLRPLLLHDRDQLAGDEGEGDEDRREHDAGHGEDDLDAVRLQERAEEALRAEEQHVDQARGHRRDRERQVDQRDQEALALELELGDRPGGGEAEDEVGRHRDRRDDQRQLDRGERVALGDRREVGADALREGLEEDDDQRQQQEDSEEGDRDARSARSAPHGALGASRTAERQRQRRRASARQPLREPPAGSRPAAG